MRIISYWMTRLARKKSLKGIYHVMMRGINHQNIFEEKADYTFFIHCLRFCQTPSDPADANSFKKACNIYAYCCMTNHVHLLIQEVDLSVGEYIKRVANRYVSYYNRKYDRCGHLFQNRFRSEPCDEKSYFFTVFRYIHLNPVKAGICANPAQYPYSSWRNDYLFQKNPICHISVMFKMMNFEDLKEFMTQECNYKGIDTNGREGYRPSDFEVTNRLHEACNYTCVADFQRLDSKLQREILADLKSYGASIRQLTRLTGVSEGIIRYL